MTRVIYKYDLAIGHNSLWLPEGSRILHLADQYGSLCMWVEQDPTKSSVQKVLDVYGTGQTVYFDNGRHVGTVLMQNGLVWHVYEII